MKKLNLEHIKPLQDELNNHPVYGAIHRIEDLRVFMAHHVYSVWDFMSLAKYLQNQIAPANVPWTPHGDGVLRYFINQLVMEEESDQKPDADGNPVYASHFEMYLEAMREVGADADTPLRFLDEVAKSGVEQALASDLVPEPSRRFTETTFCMINEDAPHIVAAGLAMGREHVIPGMFRRILDNMDIDADQAPTFRYYLNRHIELDGDFHGPLSLQMLETLCAGDRTKLDEAEAAAEEAICARIRFWDGVHEAIKNA